eukprot:EG_transcript_2857
MRLGAACLALCLAAGAASNATHVVVGQTVDLSGPFAEFGQSSRAGLSAALCEANAAGGVLGRALALVTLDDGNDPATAQYNFRQLTAGYNASLLAASYGVDTFGALLPWVTQANFPYIGPHAGSPDTRSPFTRPVVNVRASWADEIATHAKLLVETLRVQRIACFYERDDWGVTLVPFLVSILGNVGLQLVASGAFNGSDVTVAPAVEGILAASRKAQAVLLLAEEDRVLAFLGRYRQDPRADPNCTFHILSVGASPSFSTKVAQRQWSNLFFSQMVPSPDSSQVIAQRFASLPAACLPAQYRADAMAFEAYIVGRLIAEVLRQMDSKSVSPTDILDRVYTSRLFYLDDLPVGLYMDNHIGCSEVLCGCNAGLRKVFVSTLDPDAGTFKTYPDFPYYQYAVTTCAAPTELSRPILFGQLIPMDDPVAHAVALAIRDGIQAAYDEEVNAGGGLMGHLFELVSVPYSGDPVVAAQALLDRYPLTAFLGCVVPDADAVLLPALAIGTYGWTAHTTEPPFHVADLRVQPSAPLELMALVSYAANASPLNLHFRVRANFSKENFTDVLIKAAHTFQVQPLTTATFSLPADALDGLADGVVVALGTDADLLRWVELLVTRPRLTLLTLSASVHRLVAANLSTAAASFSRIRFPSVSRGVVDFAEVASSTDYWLYGHLLGHLSGYALTQQYLDVQFISPATLMDVWYTARLIKQRNVVVGPYYANACSVSVDTDCGCNLGARNLALISPDNTLPEVFTYEASTCRVVYLPLVVPTVPAAVSVVLPVALGVSLGVAGLAFLLWWAACYGQRNNRSAPKDPSQPFCVLFTDIQSSTTLWASIPDVMAGALDTHHRLIRRLIARHQCYEVKTIGDSFMCATKSPAQA